MRNGIIIFVVILLVTGITVAIVKSMQTSTKSATNPDATTTSEVTGTTLLQTFQNMFGDKEEPVVTAPLIVESMPVDEKII